MNMILCGECSHWKPDAKRQNGIRYGTCGATGRYTERVSICRTPENAVMIRVKSNPTCTKKTEKKRRGPYKGRDSYQMEKAYLLSREGLSRQEIADALGISRKTAINYIWRYLKEQKGRLPIDERRNNGHPTPIIGENIETGEIIRFESMAEAKRKGSFDDASISKCCKGLRKQYKGYIWRRDDVKECKETAEV